MACSRFWQVFGFWFLVLVLVLVLGVEDVVQGMAVKEESFLDEWAEIFDIVGRHFVMELFFPHRRTGM